MTNETLICGIDEAGRGPWAGPVTAGAVILNPSYPIDGLTDSKKLSPAARRRLEGLIRRHSLAWGLGWASPREIDELNIRQATHLAMRRAIAALDHCPDKLLIDGNDCPTDLPCPAETIVKGDLHEPAISAASILAKTARDQLMIELCEQYPGYGFSAHKGYGTAAHADGLARLGPCPAHRMSFAPVARAAATH
ncbi:MAG: ribonuclease HII [Pseudomonadota bacterium]